MDFNQIISKIPKVALVFGVLALALIIIVLNNPMKNDCEIKTTIFLKEMRGIINSVRAKNKTQFAQLPFWKDRCQQGNSFGSCEDYFTGLRKLTTAMTVLPEQCQIHFSEANEGFLKYIVDGVKVMALVAWGEKPPASVAERAGWLTEVDLKSFCRLKKTLMLLASEEDYNSLRDNVYLQYPDAWPESVKIEDRDPANRPLALKTIGNPSGKFDQKQIFERSLFSIRCDLYQ